MIKLEKTEVMGLEPAIRGMRNPMNSWEKSDSQYCCGESCDDCDNFTACNPNYETYFKNFWAGGPVDCDYAIGPNDHELMMKLVKGGPVHAKFRRMITVYVDITAPLYWWKEFDTYKVGTVANSCSTMHKIHAKEFTLEDFSCEKLTDRSLRMLSNCVITELNYNRELFVNGWHGVPGDDSRDIKPGNKIYWDNMIQLLPSSYNQKRTVELNYEVLAGIYPMRKNHKLDEWREFCKWIEALPYSEVIIGAETSFQEDLEFFVNDCTKAQLEALYERVKEKLEVGDGK